MSNPKRIDYAKLVDAVKLQALLESFHRIVGIANAVIDIDGNVIARAGWQSACTDFHRVNAETCSRCIASDTWLVDSMTEGQGYAVYECLNGLVDTAAPILVDGQHVANVFTGQFLTAPPDLHFFRHQAREFGFDEAAYLEAVAAVPIIAPERVEAVTRLYAQLASTLADNGLDRLRQRQASQELARLNRELEARVAARTRALADSEAKLRAIIEAAPVPMVLIDSEGTIGDVNSAFTRSFGYSLDDVQTLTEWWAKAYPDAAYREWVQRVWAANLERARRDGAPIAPVEVVVQCKDGSKRTVLIEGAPLSDALSSMLLVALYDITERKRSEAALLNVKAIVDSSDDAIIGVNLDGTITSWNSGAERIFGYASAEVLGRSFGLLVTPGRAGDEADIIARIAAGERIGGFETVWRARSGRLVDVAATISPVVDDLGRVCGASRIARDVTARKLADAELANYRARLERMVEDRTTALSIAKEAAEAANRAKSAFLANMSHELRTPMNGIIGLTELLLRRTPDSKQRDQLGKIKLASNHLLALIGDILDLSRIEADRLKLEHMEFRLAEVLKKLVDVIGHTATAKGLALIIDVSPEVSTQVLFGDPLRLGQILLNLVGNAIKFTERGAVTVRASFDAGAGDRPLLRFEVQDTGIGVAAEDQARLFNAFEQGDASTTRRYGGTGLGLAISRRLAEAMGGTMGIVSELGHGSTFWFTIRPDPVSPAPAVALPDAAPVQPAP